VSVEFSSGEKRGKRMESQDATAPSRSAGGARGGIQVVVRAMTTLETIASHGGVLGVSQIAAHSGLSVPTVHRIVRTLVDLGYLRQEPSRLYALGPRLLLLADSSSATMRSTAQRHLARLVDELGETANLAMLDGSQVAYVAQVPSRHAMRMFTEVGKRVMPHCTAVGKALLLGTPPDEVRLLLQRNGMPRRTDVTITGPEVYVEQLAAATRRRLRARRRRAGDRRPLRGRPRPRRPIRLALSISGPAPRMTPELGQRAVPLLKQVAADFCADLA
jgi:IclR family acetate operon transcriptional repressor